MHKILSLMWSKGISDAELCNAIKINKSAVTDWKKGKTKSYLKHIDKIAQFLNVPTDYLLENEKASNETPAIISDECIKMYLELDEIDRAMIKGEIKQLLCNEKYKK